MKKSFFRKVRKLTNDTLQNVNYEVTENLSTQINEQVDSDASEQEISVFYFLSVIFSSRNLFILGDTM